MPLIRELRDNLRVSLKLTTSFATAPVFAVCLVTLLVIWRDAMALLAALTGRDALANPGRTGGRGGIVRHAPGARPRPLSRPHRTVPEC